MTDKKHALEQARLDLQDAQLREQESKIYHQRACVAVETAELNLRRAQEALDNELPQAQRAEREYDRQFTSGVTQHQTYATGLYPDVAVKGSPLWNEVERLASEPAYAPLLDQPNWPTTLTIMAATHLGIAPAVKAKATPAAPAA